MMQGTSARWAEQSGPTFPSGGGPSRKESFPRLEGLIRYACESMNVQAQQRYAQENMDAQAAVCDEIVSKGVETNAACHAVYMMVQRYINGQVLDNARRALQLLDSCVKNCGDPCHLAISEKDFLNELVRRFGPTPPPKNIIQQDILRLIETWNRTIAQKSFIKDDLGYIRDMHRLLVNKGFVFPEPDPDDVNALNGLEVKGLQTEEALKERRNLALKAKLQAYLRRGGNRNLQEANKIIKILSDYDQSDKADIRQEAADRVRDVREKTKLLTERLSAFRPGDDMNPGDAFESLVSDLRSEQHKLHSTLQNDRESEDSMSVLLTVNEEINRTVEWYDALKAGNFDEAARLSQGGAAKGGQTKASTSTAGQGDVSLIDFEDPQPAQATAQMALQKDLLGLSLADTRDSPPQDKYSSSRNIPNPDVPPGFTHVEEPPSQTSTSLLGLHNQSAPPVATPQPFKPNYNILGGSFGNNSVGNSIQQAHTNQSTKPASHNLALRPGNRHDVNPDPFAAIASSARASPGPSSIALSSKPQTPNPMSSNPPKGNLNKTQNKITSLVDVPSSDSAATEDDWDFSGAPPPEEEDFVVFNDDIKIEFQVSRASDTSLSITVVFSNNTPNPISKLEFLTGMPKMYPRKIDPISSSRLQPHQTHGAYQRFTVDGVSKGQARQVPKIKWRLSRVVQDLQKQDQGEAQSLSIN